MAPQHTRLTPSVREQVLAYRRRLQAARIPVQQLLVFGSQAKGTAQRDSDIDVAVVSTHFGKDYFGDRRRLMRLVSTKLWSIEPHPMHPDDFNDRWSTFAHEVKTYGIPVE